MVHGAALCALGRFARSRERLAQALELLHSTPGSAIYLSNAHVFDQIAACLLGRFLEVAQSAPVLIEDAARRGDVYAATMLASGNAVASWLALDDDPVDARARFEHFTGRYGWQGAYLTTDMSRLFAEQRLLAYGGDFAGSLARTCEQWPAIVGAQFLRMQWFRVWLLQGRGAAAAGVLRRGGPDTARARAIASADARGLRRTRLDFAPGLAALLEAALSRADGNDEHVSAHLRLAIDTLDANELPAYAAAARRRLGELLGGDEGRALLAEGDATMLAQGVKNLDQMTEMLVPGCRSR